jgi:hypothetical protein
MSKIKVTNKDTFNDECEGIYIHSKYNTTPGLPSILLINRHIAENSPAWWNVMISSMFLDYYLSLQQDYPVRWPSYLITAEGVKLAPKSGMEVG